MKKNSKNYYRRPLTDFPSVIVALAWVAIWFLWPDRDEARSPVGRAREMTVVYAGGSGMEIAPYELPIGAELNSMISSSVLEGREDVPEPILSEKTGVPVFMENRQAISVPGTGERPGLVREALAGLSAYSPRLEREKEGTGSEAGKRRGVVVAVAPWLGGSGFMMPDINPEELESFGQAWQVTAYIEMNAEGRAERVFVESEGAYPEASAFVLGKLRQARLSEAGRKCEGRVKISYGIE